MNLFYAYAPLLITGAVVALEISVAWMVALSVL